MQPRGSGPRIWGRLPLDGSAPLIVSAPLLKQVAEVGFGLGFQVGPRRDASLRFVQQIVFSRDQRRFEGTSTTTIAKAHAALAEARPEEIDASQAGFAEVLELLEGERRWPAAASVLRA
jgi:hypothetical protein